MELPDLRSLYVVLEARVSILAVIVVYQQEPAQAVSLGTLLRAYAAASRDPEAGLHLSVLVVDNTPARVSTPALPPGVVYLACPGNLGLANAYNQALLLAREQGHTWLLTLDQDTALPEDFVSSLGHVAAAVQATPSVAAILPQISSDGAMLSPYFFRAGAFATRFPYGYTGSPDEQVFAFNSAATLRVDALEQIGGYDPYFWLDNSDAQMFHRLSLVGKRVFVAGKLQVQHNFSMKSMQQRVSPWRYRHMLFAESAFWDKEMNRLAGLERTLRLAVRLLKQLRRRDSRELQSLTLWFLLLRLLRSRAHRRFLFRLSVEDHLGSALALTALPARSPKVSVCMASYNGARYIDAQLCSILTQLKPDDEVVIVDDASSDGTRERIAACKDGRIRLIEHASNQGVVRTFEDAVRNATGDVIFLSDDDDVWAPTKVQDFLSAFEANARVQVVISAVSLIDSQGAPFRDVRFDRGGLFTRGFLRNILKNQYQGSAMALRAGFLGSVLPFPRGRAYLHDAWIGTTVDRVRGEMTFLPKPLLQYRRHPENYSRKLSRWTQLKARLQLLWDHGMRTLRL